MLGHCVLHPLVGRGASDILHQASPRRWRGARASDNASVARAVRASSRAATAVESRASPPRRRRARDRARRSGGAASPPAASRDHRGRACGGVLSFQFLNNARRLRRRRRWPAASARASGASCRSPSPKLPRPTFQLAASGGARPGIDATGAAPPAHLSASKSLSPTPPVSAPRLTKICAPWERDCPGRRRWRTRFSIAASCVTSKTVDAAAPRGRLPPVVAGAALL